MWKLVITWRPKQEATFWRRYSHSLEQFRIGQGKFYHLEKYCTNGVT